MLFSTRHCGKHVYNAGGFPQDKVFHNFSTGFSTGFPQVEGGEKGHYYLMKKVFHSFHRA